MSPTRRKRVLAAMIVALCAVGILQALGASPAAADPGWTRVPGAHWCHSTGYDAGGYQGVVCVDLDWGSVTGGRNYRMSIELKCGTSSGTQQCISAKAVGHYHMTNPNNEEDVFTSADATARCVPTGPVCDPTDTIFRHPALYMMPSDTCLLFDGEAYADKDHSAGFTLPDRVKDFTDVDSSPSISVCGHS